MSIIIAPALLLPILFIPQVGVARPSERLIRALLPTGASTPVITLFVLYFKNILKVNANNFPSNVQHAGLTVNDESLFCIAIVKLFLRSMCTFI